MVTPEAALSNVTEPTRLELLAKDASDTVLVALYVPAAPPPATTTCGLPATHEVVTVTLEPRAIVEATVEVPPLVLAVAVNRP